MLQMGRHRRWWHALKIDGLILAVSMVFVAGLIIGMIIGSWL